MTDSEELQKIKEKVDNYFIEALKTKGWTEDTLEYVINRPLIENVDSLICRVNNFSRELQQLKAIEKQYREDSHKAYHDAFEKAKEEIVDKMTKMEAIKLVRKMTIEEIVELEGN
jgi:hypothetical protein